MSNPIQGGVGYGFTSSGFGFTINTSQPFAESDAPPHPFLVTNLGLVGEDYMFSVVSGTVDNLVPQLGTAADESRYLDSVPQPTEAWNFDGTTNYSYIYLKIGADISGASDIYPVNDGTNVLYPRVISNGTELTASNNHGYLLLATAYKDPLTNAITVWQYIRSSQWSDRVRVIGSTAKYFFAAV